ncbi:hypothetical protein VIGAN_07245700 [Vigna angularis var. angularis]|uniref:Uncharacterized protein n=1 Tax=Vigna angularis var. angularis TaxID=157739 RepID=A0A0S3SL01_PHAAN|nr:hypothetical protein VIGAN_07245700 [Vigna angularis var. angularis]
MLGGEKHLSRAQGVEEEGGLIPRQIMSSTEGGGPGWATSWLVAGGVLPTGCGTSCRALNCIGPPYHISIESILQKIFALPAHNKNLFAACVILFWYVIKQNLEEDKVCAGLAATYFQLRGKFVLTFTHLTKYALITVKQIASFFNDKVAA